MFVDMDAVLGRLALKFVSFEKLSVKVLNSKEMNKCMSVAHGRLVW